jgi:F-type H+-transporting ATPase subunit gamma
MKKSTQVYQQYEDIITVENISHILESVATIRIRQIKDQVIASREFFQRLWGIYSQLRVTDEDADRLDTRANKIDRSAVILITANTGLTGEIDSRLVNTVLSEIKTRDIDVFVVGKHGESLLKQQGVTPKQAFALPSITTTIDVTDIVSAITQYKEPIVYYQSYESLTSQKVVYFSLVETVQRLTQSEREVHSDQVIYPDECLFEPSIGNVVEYLETMMIGATLTEVILESSLAQLASRFNSMNAAGSRAEDMTHSLFRRYVQLHRYESDESNRRYHRRKVHA